MGNKRRKTPELLLAAMVGMAACFHDSATARQAVENRTVWGSVVPTSTSGTVKLNLHIRCASGELIHKCTIEVYIPSGSNVCDICNLLSGSINNNACAISNGYSASCENLQLVIRNNSLGLCAGARVMADPEGFESLRLGLDVQSVDISWQHYLRFYETASGIPVAPTIDPGVTVVFTADYPNTMNAQAFAVTIPTTHGMSPDDMAMLIASAFDEMHVDGITAEGPAVRFDPPRRSPKFDGVGLRARWLPTDPPNDSCRVLEVTALPGPSAFALASAEFDVFVDGGSWTHLQIVAADANGSAGFSGPAGVSGVNISQTLIPGVEPAPDPSNELVLWRGTWCSSDPFPRCQPAYLQTRSFKIFTVDPCNGFPPPCDRSLDRQQVGVAGSPRPSIDQSVTEDGWDVVGLFGADCEPQPGTFKLMILINDDSLGYAMSAEPNLRCATHGTFCDAPPCVADFNKDGVVDMNDWIDFFAAFENGDMSADINNDGFVDIDDYFLFLAYFGQGC